MYMYSRTLTYWILHDSTRWILQTGDPLGEERGGKSVWGLVRGKYHTHE